MKKTVKSRVLEKKTSFQNMLNYKISVIFKLAIVKASRRHKRDKTF